MSARNALAIEADDLVITPRGMDKVWGFRRRIVVPLRNIADVQVERNPGSVGTGWRGPGLDAFGKLVGTFHPRGGRHYWNYSGRGDALAVVLDGSQHFDRLYLSVGDADAGRRLIEDARG